MASRLTQKLKALDESGKPVEIHVYQKVIDTTDMRHGRSEALGRVKDAFTADGRALSYLDEKTFQVIETGEKLRLI